MTVYQRCGTRKDAERFEASERTRAKRTVIEMLQHKLLQPCKRVDPDIPDVCVYLLMLNGKVVHIGLSLDRPVRVAAHRTNGRPFDQVFYIATEAHESIALEKTLIRAIKPRQKRTHRADNRARAVEHAIFENNGAAFEPGEGTP